MNVKRTAMIGVAAVAVAVWISAATTSNMRTVAPVVPTKPNVVDKSGAELAVEIQRLHERLRPGDAPVHARVLSGYAAKTPAPAPTATAVPTASAAPSAQAPLAQLVAPLKLEGLA